MQTKQFLTVAVLGAALLPMAGLRAADDSNANMSSSDRMGAADSMSGGDAGEFRDQLHHLQRLFSHIRDNSNLSLASQDVLVAQSYAQMNRHLVHESLGVLDHVTMNWKHIDTPEGNVQQMGSKDMARYAAESDDTAFVRNTVWQLQSELLAAKLNGREDNPITKDMMEMLDAAVSRADNPNFRVASASSTHKVQLSEWNWSRSETASAPVSASASEQVASNSAHEWREVTIEHESLPARNQMVAQADTTTTTREEVTTDTTPAPETTERVGSADLPKTGGAPELLYMLGSSFMGLGGMLLRKRRS